MLVFCAPPHHHHIDDSSITVITSNMLQLALVVATMMASRQKMGIEEICSETTGSMKKLWERHGPPLGLISGRLSRHYQLSFSPHTLLLLEDAPARTDRRLLIDCWMKPWSSDSTGCSLRGTPHCQRPVPCSLCGLPVPVSCWSGCWPGGFFRF